MRYFVPFCLLLQLLLTATGFAQTVNFEDGFEDGDFTSNPEWAGDTTNFVVTNPDNNYLLQLNGADGGGVSYLTTPSANSEGIWNIYINLNDFSPSDGNRTDIFLMSDIADLEGPVNGYALRAGENGSSDVFKLVRYDTGTESSTVLAGTTDISSGGAFRVEVERQDGGIWQMKVAENYDGVPMQEGGTQTDTTYSGTSYFGVRVNYTSTRRDKFLFDFKIDLPPFSITDVAAENSYLDILLSRPYNLETVDKNGFWVDGGIGAPASVSFPASDVIRLNFNNPLPSGKYTLTTPLIEDLHGLELMEASAPVVIPDEFQPGDVVINEFVYDPPTGVSEYVEIKNTTKKYLNLNNWKLGDDSALNAITTNTLILEPYDYLVLSGDTASLSNVFGHRNYVQMSSFSALNNTGDDIRLITDEGITADSLSYAPSWGGSKAALERRSASAPSIYRENWGDSPSADSGTPGLPNEIDTDQTPPSFDELTIADAATLQLTFSERLEANIASTTSNYSLHPTRTIKSVSVDYNTVTLSLDQELQSGTNYQVKVESLQDIFGNVMQTSALEATYLRFSTPLPGDVIINEILYTRRDGDDPEFVELYNASSKNFELLGWKLGDAVSSTTLDFDLQLLSGEYLVLTDNRAFADSLDNTYFVTGFPSLNDAGDAIYIQSSEGHTIDSLYYQNEWSNPGKGISIERKDPKAASNDPANWQAHPGPTRYSPAGINVSYQKDETPPDVIFSKLLPDGFIQVYFSEFISLTSDLSFTLGQQPLRITFFDSTQGNSIKLHASSPKVHNSKTAQTLSVFNLTDVRGNVTPVAEIPLAHKMEPESVVINEIMYNPLEDPKDNLPNQSEYVELRNTTDRAISLEGIYLHDAPDEIGQIRTVIPVSTYSSWIEPQGMALIYADEATEFAQSRAAHYFEIPDHQTASVIRVHRKTLSLGSTDDAVYLSDSTGTVIDSVYYDDNWHNPNFLDTRGISLERIDPSGPGNHPSNWGSSTHKKGGTPYAENTLYQVSEETPNHVGISFSPNPFSPDNDGFNDNLFINYRLGAPDYLMKVRIFDRYGRLVRNLVDGQPAGFEGSLIWDGRRDDGTRNRIGIYIVVFEAFNSTQGNNQAFKETVVLARHLN